MWLFSTLLFFLSTWGVTSIATLQVEITVCDCNYTWIRSRCIIQLLPKSTVIAIEKVSNATWCKVCLKLHRKWCDRGTNTISKSHCGSFWKILISFSTWLGLPVKFITLHFESCSWNVRMLPLVDLCEATHACQMQTLNWINLVLGGCVGVQNPVADCDSVNMGAFSW